MSPRARSAELHVEQVGTVSVARVPGPALLDPLVISDVGKQLTQLVETLGPRPRVVLNFSRVEHLSSTMVGTVMALHTRVDRQGGRLAVCGLRQHLAVVFSITRLDRVLNLYPGEAEALLSF